VSAWRVSKEVLDIGLTNYHVTVTKPPHKIFRPLKPELPPDNNALLNFGARDVHTVIPQQLVFSERERIRSAITAEPVADVLDQPATSPTV
jgi:hypothetical protein